MKLRLTIWLASAVLVATAPGAVAQAPAKTHSTVSSGSPSGAGTGNGKAADKVLSTASAEQDPATQAVGERFSQRFAGMPVVAVRRTPYGLFEVQIGMNLVYTDEQVSFVLDGTLVDAATRRDVTRERLEKISAVPFEELPLDLAIKQVRGKGERRLAIFEDPNCGYCKQLRRTLQDVDNVTIYTFLYPILAPDSADKARDVWCSADPARAWDDWMLRGKVPAGADCANPIQEVLALGRKLMVQGTPALFFTDGSRVSGAVPRATLEARLK